MEKSVVMTVAGNPNHHGLVRLRESCNAWGWELIELPGPFVGWGNRIWRVAKKSKELKDSGYCRFVVSVDAFDVVAISPPDEVANHFESYGNPAVLLSVEGAVWPNDPGVRERYPERKQPWWFVHSQFSLDLNQEIPAKLTDCSDFADDQRHLTKVYLDGTPGFALDLSCKIVQSVAHSRPYENFFEWHDSRMINKITDSQPLFIHGNGGTDLSEFFEPHFKRKPL